MIRTKRVLVILWKVLGSLCIIYAGGLMVTPFLSGICDQLGSYSLTTNDADGDRKVKATVFTTDCGAMTATRTFVKFSSAFIDGRRFGDTVVVLTGVECGQVESAWETNRDFAVSYPRTAGVEFAVAKTHGVNIQLKPK